MVIEVRSGSSTHGLGCIVCKSYRSMVCRTVSTVMMPRSPASCQSRRRRFSRSLATQRRLTTTIQVPVIYGVKLATNLATACGSCMLSLDFVVLLQWYGVRTSQEVRPVHTTILASLTVVTPCIILRARSCSVCALWLLLALFCDLGALFFLSAGDREVQFVHFCWT